MPALLEWKTTQRYSYFIWFMWKLNKNAVVTFWGLVAKSPLSKLAGAPINMPELFRWTDVIISVYYICTLQTMAIANIHNKNGVWCYCPILACEFQAFSVGFNEFRTLELTAAPTNLHNEAYGQSCSVQLRGPERAYQNNESLRSSRTNRRFSRPLRVDKTL